MKSLKQREIELIIEVLKKHSGHKQKTARALGISRFRLRTKMLQYDIKETKSYAVELKGN